MRERDGVCVCVCARARVRACVCAVRGAEENAFYARENAEKGKENTFYLLRTYEYMDNIVCMYVLCMYVCVCVCVVRGGEESTFKDRKRTHSPLASFLLQALARRYVCVYICMCMHMYVYTYVCVYICIRIHMYVYKKQNGFCSSALAWRCV